MTEEILKKAHDYAMNNIERTEEGGYDIIEEMRLVNAYLVGAKDNAPQWHYPSKGEYPKDDTDVLVAHYTRFNTDTKQPLGELQCKISNYLGKKWHETDTGCGNIDYWLNKPDMVYAWTEIELPKEVLK